MKAAVEKFIKTADWLGEADEPAVAALRNCAESLDDKYQSSMVVQFRLIYNDLNEKGGIARTPDDQDTFLAQLGV